MEGVGGMAKYSIEELEKMLNEEKAKEKDNYKKKKRMKSGKKALFLAFSICIILLIFTMSMIYLDKDTSSLGILATAGVGVLPVMYGIYDFNNTKINLKHMDENYIKDYDDERGIY